MTRMRVGVLFGGRSGEHEISLLSAASVLGALDRSKYDVVPIGITKEGRWLSTGRALSMLPPEREISETFEQGMPMVIAAEPVEPRSVDVVFPVLHGTFGEDGAIQGLLELADTPYVGAGVLGSAVGMDKDVMKRLLRDRGLPIVEYWSVLAPDIDHFVKSHAYSLPYPVFVKPANLGSSVGISRITAPSDLRRAILAAAEYDRKVIVEKGLDAREIELGVMGNSNPAVSIPGEIRPSGAFYDYQAKYVDDDSELIIPADLTEAQLREVQHLALESFKTLECAGLGRVDLLLENSTGRFHVNEINTMPGFTSISMFPRLWEASGVSYSELLDRLIGFAIERHDEKSTRRTSYVSGPGEA